MFGCDDTLHAPRLIRSITVPDWQYVYGKFFYLADPLGDAPPPHSILEIHLYLDNKDYRDDVERGAQPARVWLDPDANTPTEPATGSFHRLLEETDFQYYNDRIYGLPFIALTTQISNNQTLAMAYRQVIGPDTTEVGDFFTVTGDTLDLKMLRPSQDEWGGNDLALSEWTPVRNLEAKNIYYLGVRNLDPEQLTLQVVHDGVGADGKKFVTLWSQEQEKQTRSDRNAGVGSEEQRQPLPTGARRESGRGIHRSRERALVLPRPATLRSRPGRHRGQCVAGEVLAEEPHHRTRGHPGLHQGSQHRGGNSFYRGNPQSRDRARDL